MANLLRIKDAVEEAASHPHKDPEVSLRLGDGRDGSTRSRSNVWPKMLYPSLIEAKGHCPPEDVGGPRGPWRVA
jgi:hypothetical protein